MAFTITIVGVICTMFGILIGLLVAGLCRAAAGGAPEKIQITACNQLNDNLSIEFCCGGKEYRLKHNEETVIEAEDGACMYFDIVTG